MSFKAKKGTRCEPLPSHKEGTHLVPDVEQDNVRYGKKGLLAFLLVFCLKVVLPFIGLLIGLLVGAKQHRVVVPKTLLFFSEHVMCDPSRRD